MKLNPHLIAGVASSGWSIVLGFLVIPFYLKFLGVEAYGLVGFFATLQALFQVLDLGLAPTINREVARGSASGQWDSAATLLNTLSVIYWGVGLVIAVLMMIAAPFIAEHWLSARQLGPSTIVAAVMLMGVVIACRWPVGLYQGALIGAHQMLISSSVNAIVATLGSLGAVGILAFVSPTIEALFLWQAFVGFLHAGIMRFACRKIIPSKGFRSFDINELKRVWKFSAGMAGIGVFSAILAQMDKVILSKLISLEDFGYYTLAALVAGGLSIIILPNFNIIYPRLSALVAAETPEDQIAAFYRTSTRRFLSVLFPIAMTVAVFAGDIIELWTQSPTIALHAAPLAGALALGTALNGAMTFPYALQLAKGLVRLPLMICVTLTILMIPLTIGLVLSLGMIGGALGWLILNMIYVPCGTFVTHRFFLRNIGWVWITRDVALPFVISFALMGVAGIILHGLNLPPLATTGLGAGFMLFNLLLLTLMDPGGRNLLRNTLSSIRNAA